MEGIRNFRSFFAQEPIIEESNFYVNGSLYSFFPVFSLSPPKKQSGGEARPFLAGKLVVARHDF